MTRREQIENAFKEANKVILTLHVSSDPEKMFRLGAEWADANPDRDIREMEADLDNDTFIINELEFKLAVAVEALNRFACWSEGEVVAGHFDNPGIASAAREALDKIKKMGVV